MTENSMQYAQLGRSGLSVSRMVLGTLNFGVKTEEPDAWSIMERAHDLGINFFDTSDVYGSETYDGDAKSEEFIGRWIAQGGGRRERTVLATKVFMPRGKWPNSGGLSALHIREACDASLRRLQTDHIDLYQMHQIDRRTPWEEIWEAMSILRTQGKILYTGSSNFAGWHLATAQSVAKDRHLLGLVSEQSIYNLATRDIEREVIPASQYHGIGVLAWSPLHRGILGGLLARERATGNVSSYRYSREALEAIRPQLARYEELCELRGFDPAQVAMAWLLTRPGVTGVVTGPSTLQHLNTAATASQLELDHEMLRDLDEIFPAEQTAPEAYTQPRRRT